MHPMLDRVRVPRGGGGAIINRAARDVICCSTRKRQTISSPKVDKSAEQRSSEILHLAYPTMRILQSPAPPPGTRQSSTLGSIDPLEARQFHPPACPPRLVSKRSRGSALRHKGVSHASCEFTIRPTRSVHGDARPRCLPALARILVSNACTQRGRIWHRFPPPLQGPRPVAPVHGHTITQEPKAQEVVAVARLFRDRPHSLDEIVAMFRGSTVRTAGLRRRAPRRPLDIAYRFRGKKGSTGFWMPFALDMAAAPCSVQEGPWACSWIFRATRGLRRFGPLVCCGTRKSFPQLLHVIGRLPRSSVVPQSSTACSSASSSGLDPVGSPAPTAPSSHRPRRGS